MHAAVAYSDRILNRMKKDVENDFAVLAVSANGIAGLSMKWKAFPYVRVCLV
jgi:transposase-like protein